MSLLTINLDIVAALREVRHLNEPDPAQAAVLAELAGADGISVQLRRDRKYVRDRDLYILKGVVKTKLIVEMPPVDDIIERAMEVKPWMVTLVADHADADTPVSTIDFGTAPIDFGDLTNRFKGVGVGVCYFVEPESDQVKGAIKSGAAAVMLDCSGYTGARSVEEAQTELDRLDRIGRAASKAGLTVFFGRGLNYTNIRPLTELGYVDEFVIGHSVSSRAVLVGFERAVREMAALVRMAAPAQS